MSWSLTIGSTTQTLAAWQITSASLVYQSLAPDGLIFTIEPQDGLAAPTIAHGAAVTLTQDDTTRFTGEIIRRTQAADPSIEAISYEAAGPWHYLSQLVFEQTWKVFQGWTGGIPGSTPILADSTSSHIVLNQSVAGALQGTRAQIAEVLQWAIDDGCALQFTEANLADMNIPKREQKDILCSEAIARQLDYMDAVTWFDYSTSPPTFHCKRRAALTAASLAIGSNIQAIGLTPRDEQKVPYVRVVFEKVYQDNMGSFIQRPEDIYPDPLPVQKKGGLLATLVLAPTVSTTVVQELESEAIPTSGSGETAILNFFKTVKPELANALEYADLALVSGSFARTGSEPYYISTGAVAEWMEGTQEDIEVGCKISYRQKDVAGATSVDGHKVREQFIKVRLKSTDLETGTYKTTFIDDVGEDPSEFTGIAQQIYNDLNVLAWSGQVRIVEDEPSFSVGVGNVLNLTGGQTAWASMDAVVREVEVDITSGTTTISVGPNPHLTAGQIADLLRVNRTRFTSHYSAQRTSAGVAGETKLPKELPRENTTEAPKRYEELRIAGPDSSGQQCIELTATGYGSKPAIVLAKRTSAGLGTSKILIELSRAGENVIRLREAKVCLSDATVKYVTILASETYETPRLGETPIGSEAD